MAPQFRFHAQLITIRDIRNYVAHSLESFPPTYQKEAIQFFFLYFFSKCVRCFFSYLVYLSLFFFNEACLFILNKLCHQTE